jgi:sugar transferase (PEP-CTERM/EpsH1 system associated)
MRPGKAEFVGGRPGNGPPLVVHIVRRLAMGGLENGLVNLINHMPPDRYRHAIVSLTDVTSFRDRLVRKDVEVVALNKAEGQDFGVYRRLWKVLRRLRPEIIHTRNLASLECQVVAAFARVPARIHGEHGRDIYDLDGLNPKYNFLRRAVRPFVHRYTAVSEDLAGWLVRTVGVRPARVTRICNGVDTQRFHPSAGERSSVGPEGFAARDAVVIGTVGRMEAVKDQLTLVRAFIQFVAVEAAFSKRLRLVIFGDGPLRQQARQLLRSNHAEHLAWLAGESNDIPEAMRRLDLFVLPSLREGISNTILEAMATGLPVVATRVGGNPELVEEGRTGTLVPPADPASMAAAIRSYVGDPEKLARHGRAARKRAEAEFSIEAMVNGYLAVYDAVLKDRRGWDMGRRAENSRRCGSARLLDRA